MAKRSTATHWRLPVVPLAIALVCLLGVLVLLYPSAANWFSDYEQSTKIDDYTAKSHEVSPADRAEQLLAAQLYNEQLFGTASVEANERLPRAAPSSADDDYSTLLATDSNGLMGRLRIPTIDVDLPIYHGTSDEVLGRGLGHLEGTALPVGGEGTHSVLTGHRGLATAELFTRLNEVVVGDTFTVEVTGEVLVYQVVDTQVVEPDKTQTLYPVAGDDLVTLVTCTPLGINSHRILVTAERVLPTPPEEIAASGRNAAGAGFPWWMLGAAGALAAIVLYVRWAGAQEAAVRGSSGAQTARPKTNRPRLRRPH
jgi:sortase A